MMREVDAAWEIWRLSNGPHWALDIPVIALVSGFTDCLGYYVKWRSYVVLPYV